MRRIFILSAFLIPACLMSQSNNGHAAPQGTVTPSPEVKPGTNPNKKVVKSQKEVVFTEKLEWIRVDSLSGKNEEVVLPEPGTSKPK